MNANNSQREHCPRTQARIIAARLLFMAAHTAANTQRKQQLEFFKVKQHRPPTFCQVELSSDRQRFRRICLDKENSRNTNAVAPHGVILMFQMLAGPRARSKHPSFRVDAT